MHRSRVGFLKLSFISGLRSRSSKRSFMTGERPQTIEGENTVKGDVENDSTANDAVPEEDRERTNS